MLTDSYFHLICMFQIFLKPSLLPAAATGSHSLGISVSIHWLLAWLQFSVLILLCLVWKHTGDSLSPAVLSFFPVFSAIQLELQCWGPWVFTVTQT